MNTVSFNTAITLKSLSFISDANLRQILTDILNELDNIVLIGASRSTVYLSMSTLEGILTKLIEINITNATQYFPNYKGTKKKLKDLTFDEKIGIANKLGFIANEYYETFLKMKNFRNYMHPHRELVDKEKIDLGISQISLGILNHIMSKLGNLRFIQGQVWEVISGEPLYESQTDTIEFNRGNTRTDSFIVTEGFLGKDVISIAFDLVLSNKCLLNFVYNYEKGTKFNMLRFDARNEDDCGFLFCKHSAEWEYVEKFKYKLNINTTNRIEIKLMRDEITLKINDVLIKFATVDYPKFNNNLQIGFFNELTSLTVSKLKIT